MKMLKVIGDDSAQVIKLFGNPKKQHEPEEVRIEFPGGYISVARCDQPQGPPQFWAHIGVFHPNHQDKHRVANMDQHGDPGPTAKVIDARIDCFDSHASDTIVLAESVPLAAACQHPNVDHIAIKIAPESV